MRSQALCRWVTGREGGEGEQGGGAKVDPFSDLSVWVPFPLLPLPLPCKWPWGSGGQASTFSPRPVPQAALQAAAHASVDIKNVLDFYKQWKEIG